MATGNRGGEILRQIFAGIENSLTALVLGLAAGRALELSSIEIGWRGFPGAMLLFFAVELAIGALVVWCWHDRTFPRWLAVLPLALVVQECLPAGGSSWHWALCGFLTGGFLVGLRGWRRRLFLLIWLGAVLGGCYLPLPVVLIAGACGFGGALLLALGRMSGRRWQRLLIWLIGLTILAGIPFSVRLSLHTLERSAVSAAPSLPGPAMLPLTLLADSDTVRLLLIDDGEPSFYVTSWRMLPYVTEVISLPATRAGGRQLRAVGGSFDIAVLAALPPGVEDARRSFCEEVWARLSPQGVLVMNSRDRKWLPTTAAWTGVPGSAGQLIAVGRSGTLPFRTLEELDQRLQARLKNSGASGQFMPAGIFPALYREDDGLSTSGEDTSTIAVWKLPYWWVLIAGLFYGIVRLWFGRYGRMAFGFAAWENGAATGVLFLILFDFFLSRELAGGIPSAWAVILLGATLFALPLRVPVVRMLTLLVALLPLLLVVPTTRGWALSWWFCGILLALLVLQAGSLRRVIARNSGMADALQWSWFFFGIAAGLGMGILWICCGAQPSVYAVASALFLRGFWLCRV